MCYAPAGFAVWEAFVVRFLDPAIMSSGKTYS
jgi:hypothetical protein